MGENTSIEQELQIEQRSTSNAAELNDKLGDFDDMLRGDNTLSYTFDQFIKGSELMINARYGRRDINKPRTVTYSDQLTVLRANFTNPDYRVIYTDVYNAVKDMFNTDYGGNGSIKHVSIKVSVNPNNDYDVDIRLIINGGPMPILPNANCANNFSTTDDWDWANGSCDDVIPTSGAADQLQTDLNLYFDDNPGTIVVPQQGSIISYMESYPVDLYPYEYPNTNDVTPMDNERDQRFYYNVNQYDNFQSHTCVEFDDLNFYYCEMIDIAIEENPNSYQYLIMDVNVFPDGVLSGTNVNILHKYSITYAKPIYHVFHGLVIDDGPINVTTDNTTIY